jgi:hypothetical protein
MSGAANRRKGLDFERTIVRRLACIFGADNVRRGLQFQGGSDSPDVVCPGLWIECKRGKLTNPRAALRQALGDAAGKGTWPIAVTKDDGEPAHVTLLFDDFADLLAEWHAMRLR